MKQFYSRFRVMLLTFTFGLAVVPFSNALYEKWSGISADLPEVGSNSPIFVIVSTERRPINMNFDTALITSGKFLSDCKFEVSKGKRAKNNLKKKKLKSRPVANKMRN